MRFVCGKVVPKVLEICALAALNQRFGSRTVKAEVPEVGVVVNCPPPSYAREEGIHHNQFFHLGRKLRGVGVSDHEADVVANDFCFLDTERAGQRMNSYCCRLHIETICRNSRVPNTGQVGCNHGESLSQ